MQCYSSHGSFLLILINIGLYKAWWMVINLRNDVKTVQKLPYKNYCIFQIYAVCFLPFLCYPAQALSYPWLQNHNMTFSSPGDKAVNGAGIFCSTCLDCRSPHSSMQKHWANFLQALKLLLTHFIQSWMSVDLAGFFFSLSFLSCEKKKNPHFRILIAAEWVAVVDS